MKRTVLVIVVCAGIAMCLAAAGVQDQGLVRRTQNLEERMQLVAALPGEVRMWWGDKEHPPDGWEICDGNEVSTPGAQLTGKKPNLVDRFPKGAPGDRHGRADLLAKGSNNMPAHYHGPGTLAAGGGGHEHAGGDHSHAIPMRDRCEGGGNFGANAGLDSRGAADIVLGGGGHTHSAGPHGHDFTGKVGKTETVDGDGADTSGANQPAYCEIFFIIRVK